MRWFALTLGATLAICGCAGSSAPQESEPAGEAPAAPIVSAANLNSEGELYLSNDGNKLSVGDPSSLAMDLFPKPKTGKVFDMREPPEVLGKAYKVRGWVSGGEGFGVILLGDQVALAVRTVSGKEASDVDEAADIYMRIHRGIQPVTRAGRNGKYWFFADRRKRLMICGARTRKGDWTVTIALGDFEIMDQLRMSDKAAMDDLRIADQEESE